MRVGIIGTAHTIEKARDWLIENADGVTGTEKHPEFPGFHADRGYFSSLLFDDDQIARGQIEKEELEEVLDTKGPRERFIAAVELLGEKLRVLANEDRPPEYIVVGLPDRLIEKCKVADYADPELGMVHRDLRRAFKAVAMRYRIPTQFFRQATMEGRDEDHPSRIAWNYFSGLYFKAGGLPWGPTDLTPGSCYVGVSFFRPLGTKRSRLQTSLVQAFDEHGEGLVLRGPEFEWDVAKEGAKSPHLSGEHAARVIELVLTQYREHMGQFPARLVLHKSSRYWPDERRGFESALAGKVGRYALLALEPQSAVRLLTESKYPALRGTRFTVGELDFLYTTGFISALNEFHGLHVPAPLQIADHIEQDTPRDQLLREILTLTKMNWNSAMLGGLLPITMKFATLVGEIIRELPEGREPLPQFKFYM